MSKLLTFLGAIVSTILARVANELWDQVWAEILNAVQAAEEKWTAEGAGKLKRDWVVAQVTSFIDERLKAAGKPLAFLDRMIVRLFVGAVADGVVGYFNDTLGRDWRTKAAEFEAKWAAALPVIE